MSKRVAIGIVKSDKMTKTRVVTIARRVKHPLYGKFVREKTTCYVHDPEEQAGQGDRVEIIESRPQSKTKRWELVRVIEKSTEVDVAALKAARQAHDEAESGE